jgi:hypothetical protein
VAKPKGLTKLAVAVPILVTVTAWGLLVEPTVTLPKSSEEGERLKMMLPVPLPVPVRSSLWGLSGALSVMTTLPFRGPAAVGVMVTVMVQEAPGCRVRGHW